MTTSLILGGLLLLAVGLVASQLFRLKDWLNRQPPVLPDGAEGTGDHDPRPLNEQTPE